MQRNDLRLGVESEGEGGSTSLMTIDFLAYRHEIFQKIGANLCKS